MTERDGAAVDVQLLVVETQVLTDGERLGGERLYGSARLMDLMLGPFAAELVPIEGRTQWALPDPG